MPTVRKLERQVSTIALPGARLTAAETPESRGAGLALAKGRTTEATGELAGTVGTLAYHQYSRIQQEERQKANQVIDVANRNRLADFEFAHVHDPQHGALAMHGKDAFALPETVDQAAAQEIDAIRQGLSNDEQRLQFAKVAGAWRQDLRITVARHVSAEMNAYDQQETTALVSNAHQLAITHAFDPRRASIEIGNGVSAIQQYGQRHGDGPDVIAAKVNGFRSDTHVGIIKNLLANEETRAAQIYFEETKHDIEGDKLDDVTTMLKAGSTRQQSQEATATILAAGGTLAEQRARAKQIKNADVQDDVLARLEHEDGVRRFTAEQTDRDNLNTAYHIVTQTHDVDKIPPALLANIEAHQPALRAYAASLSQGQSIATDPNTLYDLLTLSSANPTAFLQENIMGYVDRLGKSDLEQLMQKQAAMRTGNRKEAEALFVNETTQNRIVDEGLMSMRLSATPDELRKPENNTLADRIGAFRRAVREAVSLQEAATGTHVTDDAVQKIVDRLITVGGTHKVGKGTEGGVKGTGLFGTGFFSDLWAPTYIFEVHDARKEAAAIPWADLRQIDDALRRHGWPVDDANRVRLYKQHLSMQGR